MTVAAPPTLPGPVLSPCPGLVRSDAATGTASADAGAVAVAAHRLELAAIDPPPVEEIVTSLTLRRTPSGRMLTVVELRACWDVVAGVAPHRITAVAGRLLLDVPALGVGGYTGFSGDVTLASGLETATLVSSLLPDGTHRPALDLDFPAGLYTDAAGVRWLRLEPDSPAARFHGAATVGWADRAMASLGLHRSSVPAGPLVDLAGFGVSVAALAATWGLTFEELWATVAVLDVTGRPAPVPSGGVWYRVAGDALLVPSTSWWHLYLDVAVPSGAYLAAVEALAACGLQNPGFASSALRRGFTALRRPGLAKPAV